MKTLLVTAALLGLAAPPLLAQEPAPRFQLLTAAATVDGKEERMILKLDTTTGETWRYTSIHVNADPASPTVESWIRLEQNAAMTWDDLHKKTAAQKP